MRREVQGRGNGRNAMVSMHYKASEKVYLALLFCASLLFYLFFAVYDGVVICADSPSYINMHISREPLYCIFLALLRTVFSHADLAVLFCTRNDMLSLTVAVYIQSVLAAFAAWCLAKYLYREFSLGRFETAVVMCIPLLTSLLCRFAAKRASMYSNSIMTEGIACSLFLIFTRYLLDFYYNRRKKSLILASVLSFLLIATRKQMYITLILLFCVACAVCIRQKKNILKDGICLVVCVLFIVGGNLILDNGYNYIVRGEAGTHSSDNRFFATMCFYTAERESGERIEDKEARELFYQIYDACDAQGFLKHSAQKGWYNRVTHFGDHYDHIQINTMWPAIQQYVYANYEGNPVDLEEKVDEITNQIIRGVLPDVWVKVAGCFIDNCLSGFITTVSKRSPILIVYAVFVYALYLFLTVWQVVKDTTGKLSFLALYVLASIVVNVAVVSMVIFCQTRYAIYNMPLFYIALFLMFMKKLRMVIGSKTHRQ